MSTPSAMMSGGRRRRSSGRERKEKGQSPVAHRYDTRSSAKKRKSGGIGSGGGGQRKQPTTRTTRTTRTTPAKKPQDDDDDDDDDDDGGVTIKNGHVLAVGGGDENSNAVVVEVVESLGCGSHGKTFLVVDQQDPGGRQYVLKVPFNGREDIMEAENEIRVLKDLKDVAGVVRLVTYGPTSAEGVGVGVGGAVGFLLHHIEGTTVMDELISQKGKLELDQAQKMMRQLITTLISMKKRNWSHLDIKPDNILVTTKNDIDDITLIDFGTARPTNKMISDNLGSPFFEAPEIERDEQYDPAAADMHSVAKTILVALEGYPNDEEDWHTEFKISERLTAVRKRCSLAADILAGLLQEDPTQRPTAEQALEALKRPWGA